MSDLYRIGKQVALVSMGVSAALAAVKITVGILAHSTALVADGVESAGDVMASGLVYASMVIAARPPDENHPYGHGRLETLTGLAVGLLLTMTGTILSYRSWDLLSHPVIVPSAFAIWPLIGSMGIKSFTFTVKRRYGRRIHSDSLEADAWNDFVDIISGLVALAAVWLAVTQPDRFAHADNYGGVAVGLIVILLGLRVIHETALQLMDTMPDHSHMDEIRRVALSVPGALGVEKCFARKAGLQYYVDLHLEVDAMMTVVASHDIATQVRDRIREKLEWVADVLVHVEPFAE